MSVDMPYIEAELARMDAGSAPPSYLRHLHWGLFDADDLDRDDDSPARYVTAAEAMTDRVVSAAAITDGMPLLDVGCGFGGTLSHIRRHHPSCRLTGLNIDPRQLHWARRLADADVGPGSHAQIAAGPGTGTGAGAAVAAVAVGSQTGWVAGDGCRLPVRSASVDRVLAVECVFHFPSRKTFFAEAARVLRPGGMLALSDFVLAPGAMARVAENAVAFDVGGWYGRSTRPITASGYRKLAAANGFEVAVDDDVTARTLPTYPALRRIYREAGMPEATATVDGVEALARAGGWEYHVLAFRLLANGRG